MLRNIAEIELAKKFASGKFLGLNRWDPSAARSASVDAIHFPGILKILEEARMGSPSTISRWIQQIV